MSGPWTRASRGALAWVLPAVPGLPGCTLQSSCRLASYSPQLSRGKPTPAPHALLGSQEHSWGTQSHLGMEGPARSLWDKPGRGVRYLCLQLIG